MTEYTFPLPRLLKYTGELYIRSVNAFAPMKSNVTQFGVFWAHELLDRPST